MNICERLEAVADFVTEQSAEHAQTCRHAAEALKGNMRRCTCYILPHADDCEIFVGVTQSGERILERRSGEDRRSRSGMQSETADREAFDRAAYVIEANAAGAEPNPNYPKQSAAASASELEQEVLTLREYATVVTKENERLMGEVSNRERELAVVMAERDALRSRSATASVVTDAMVDRFLSWTLPKDFSPDCGISFDGRKPDQWNPSKGWPIGTNLLTDTQARAMLEHILGKS